jgi:hypothetical protein
MIAANPGRMFGASDKTYHDCPQRTIKCRLDRSLLQRNQAELLYALNHSHGLDETLRALYNIMKVRRPVLLPSATGLTSWEILTECKHSNLQYTHWAVL